LGEGRVGQNSLHQAALSLCFLLRLLFSSLGCVQLIQRFHATTKHFSSALLEELFLFSNAGKTHYGLHRLILQFLQASGLSLNRSPVPGRWDANIAPVTAANALSTTGGLRRNNAAALMASTA
jgi:surface polysaccharide O-acyltransferase-like enzyme